MIIFRKKEKYIENTGRLTDKSQTIREVSVEEACEKINTKKRYEIFLILKCHRWTYILKGVWNNIQDIRIDISKTVLIWLKICKDVTRESFINIDIRHSWMGIKGETSAWGLGTNFDFILHCRTSPKQWIRSIK